MLIFNAEKIAELQKASGAKSNTEFSRLVGISATTLWRVSGGEESPSPTVIARFKAAFPLVSFDDLLRIKLP